jgi:hypothetical protein
MIFMEYMLTEIMNPLVSVNIEGIRLALWVKSLFLGAKLQTLLKEYAK